jgi:putative addiction module killer protein
MVDIRKYVDAQGRVPFDDWLVRVRDHDAVDRVKARLKRLERGNEGERAPVGEGVMEMKIRVGKGYRVYYAWDGPAVVLLLVGGNKSTQPQDIKTAKAFWRDYNA